MADDRTHGTGGHGTTDSLFRVASRVALCKSNLFLFRISILCNQITGIAGQHIILDRSAPTLTDLYHFRDLTKMIRNLNTTCFTGFHCTNNGFIKIFPSLIPYETCCHRLINGCLNSCERWELFVLFGFPHRQQIGLIPMGELLDHLWPNRLIQCGEVVFRFEQVLICQFIPTPHPLPRRYHHL